MSPYPYPTIFLPPTNLVLASLTAFFLQLRPQHLPRNTLRVMEEMPVESKFMGMGGKNALLTCALGNPYGWQSLPFWLTDLDSDSQIASIYPFLISSTQGKRCQRNESDFLSLSIISLEITFSLKWSFSEAMKWQVLISEGHRIESRIQEYLAVFLGELYEGGPTLRVFCFVFHFVFVLAVIPSVYLTQVSARIFNDLSSPSALSCELLGRMSANSEQPMSRGSC